MATTQDLLTLKKKIERDAATYTKLYEKKDNGEDLTEFEVETAKRIENYLENLISQYKTCKHHLKYFGKCAKIILCINDLINNIGDRHDRSTRQLTRISRA